jgi:hypothetical protein
MKLSIRQAAITLALARGDMLSLDDARGVEISVQRGALWVTQERSRADHFVGPGARFTVSRRGRTVVEALERGLVQLSTA